jgi:hypothetical protein
MRSDLPAARVLPARATARKMRQSFQSGGPAMGALYRQLGFSRYAKLMTYSAITLLTPLDDRA